MTEYEFKDWYDTWSKDKLINRLMKLDEFFFDVSHSIVNKPSIVDPYTQGYSDAIDYYEALIEHYTERFRTGKVIVERRLIHEK